MAIVPQAFAGTGFLKTIAEAQKEAKAKNRMIFVDLFADWCGWCHRFEAEVVPSEAFQKATANMVLLRLDTEDNKEGTKFARDYQVGTLPTFLVLNPDLTVAATIRGYLPASQFGPALEKMVAGYRDFQKMVKSEASLTKDYPKRLEIAREFMQRRAYTESEPRFKKLMSEKGVPMAFRDEAYYNLAVQYMVQSRFADAVKTIDQFSKVQERGEYYERARLLRGDIYLQQGNLAGAAEVFRDFKTRFPNSPLIPNVDRTLPMIERQLARQ